MQSIETRGKEELNLEGADLSKADLSGFDFTGVNFKGANLKKAILTDARLIGANFDEANLEKANLENAIISESDVAALLLLSYERASFRKANLREANLKGAIIKRVNFNEANLMRANIQGTNIDGANLQKACLKEANIISSNLSNTNFEEADFQHAKGKLVNFTNANLCKTNFKGANIETANFRKANLFQCNFMYSSFNNADFRKANLNDVYFMWSNLKGANLNEVQLSGVDFGGSDLYKANLQNARLSRSKLISTNLSNANITGAIFYGTSRDEWIIEDIKCDYIYWDKHGIGRVPNDRNFDPKEFEDLYKSLPEITYYFSDDFTPITPLIVDKVVQEINTQSPHFDITLDSFHSRGRPHAIFTVCKKEHVDSATKEIESGIKQKLHELEGKYDALNRVVTGLIDQPKTIIKKVENMSQNFRNITSGRDTHIATDNSNITVNNIKNDIASLVSELTKQRVPLSYINNLKDAIESDKGAPEHKNRAFGENVSQWFNDISMKAGSTAWRLAEGTTAGTVAGIILNALKSFYGWQ